MFADPKEMASAYMRNLEVEYNKKEVLQDIIDRYKKDAHERIGRIVDVFYVDAIALTIASGYENELDQAIEIVNRLSLNDKHIYAILSDHQQMEQILIEEAEEDEYYENEGE